MVLAIQRARSMIKIRSENDLYPHRYFTEHVWKTIEEERFKSRNLESFNPVTQELYCPVSDPVTIHIQDLDRKIETVMRTESRNGGGLPCEWLHWRQKLSPKKQRMEILCAWGRADPHGGEEKSRQPKLETLIQTPREKRSKKTLACRAPMKTEEISSVGINES
jgi:hypothetical protein